MKKQNIKYSIYIFVISTFFILLLSTSLVEAKTYYTWVDKNGVTHITENKNEIPGNRIDTVKTFESRGRFDFITTNYYYVKSNFHKFIRFIVYFFIAVITLLILRQIVSKGKTEE